MLYILRFRVLRWFARLRLDYYVAYRMEEDRIASSIGTSEYWTKDAK